MPKKPNDFNSFVGKPALISRLRRQLEGAKRLGEVFPHLLLVGPSGLGKTHLAQALATEFGTNVSLRHGADSLEELTAALMAANVGDFVVVDEAHALGGRMQELLMHSIDNRRLPEWAPLPKEHQDGDDGEERAICDLTFVLATDRPGALRNALKKRMEMMERMDYYTQAEMRTIIDRIAADSKLLMSPQASNELAKICGGVPRIARHHIRNLRRHFADSDRRKLAVGDLRTYFAEFQIDELGLTQTHRRYLECLFETEANGVGIDSLATRLDLDPEYVRQEVEGQLHRAGLITVTSRGRQLTERGRRHIEQPKNGTEK